MYCPYDFHDRPEICQNFLFWLWDNQYCRVKDIGRPPVNNPSFRPRRTQHARDFIRAYVEKLGFYGRRATLLMRHAGIREMAEYIGHVYWGPEQEACMLKWREHPAVIVDLDDLPF
jgi:hypothetical protein